MSGVHRIDFDALIWEELAPCARSKQASLAGTRLRLLELQRGFVEPDWCTRGHAGYVLQGEMEVDFDGEAVPFRAGDGLLIPAGEETRHKANVLSESVRLLLVEADDA